MWVTVAVVEVVEEAVIAKGLAAMSIDLGARPRCGRHTVTIASGCDVSRIKRVTPTNPRRNPVARPRAIVMVAARSGVVATVSLVAPGAVLGVSQFSSTGRKYSDASGLNFSPSHDMSKCPPRVRSSTTPQARRLARRRAPLRRRRRHGDGAATWRMAYQKSRPRRRPLPASASPSFSWAHSHW